MAQPSANSESLGPPRSPRAPQVRVSGRWRVGGRRREPRRRGQVEDFHACSWRWDLSFPLLGPGRWRTMLSAIPGSTWSPGLARPLPLEGALGTQWRGHGQGPGSPHSGEGWPQFLPGRRRPEFNCSIKNLCTWWEKPGQLVHASFHQRVCFPRLCCGPTRWENPFPNYFWWLWGAHGAQSWPCAQITQETSKEIGPGSVARQDTLSCLCTIPSRPQFSPQFLTLEVLLVHGSRLPGVSSVHSQV